MPHERPPATAPGIPDAALWRAAGVDAAAFGELCERHMRTIHAFLRQRVGEDPAADLTAETFAQAWRGRRRLKPERDEEVIAWLHGIARNLAGSYLRHQTVETKGRRKLGMQLDYTATTADAYAELDESLSTNAVQPQLERALARLPAGQREAVSLRVVDELGYREIGRALGCSEPVARMKVARGLKALRTHLQHSGVRP